MRGRHWAVFLYVVTPVFLSELSVNIGNCRANASIHHLLQRQKSQHLCFLSRFQRLPRHIVAVADPGYMNGKIQKLRTDKFDTWKKTDILTHATHVNGWKPAVYMGCTSQNFRLFHVSNFSVRNFLIFLLMYPGSLSRQSAPVPSFWSGAISSGSSFPSPISSGAVRRPTSARLPRHSAVFTRAAKLFQFPDHSIWWRQHWCAASTTCWRPWEADGDASRADGTHFQRRTVLWAVWRVSRRYLTADRCRLAAAARPAGCRTLKNSLRFWARLGRSEIGGGLVVTSPAMMTGR